MPDASTSLLFSPWDDLQSVWLNLIQHAQETILISCFGISNTALAFALLDALKRGVKVTIGIDHKQALLHGDLHAELAAAGACVVVKPKVALEHNKLMAVDGRDGVVGSWNLSASASAQDNADVVFLNSPEIVGRIVFEVNRIIQRDEAKVLLAPASVEVPAGAAAVVEAVTP